MRASSGSGTPSRAPTAPSTRTVWPTTAALDPYQSLAQQGQHVLLYPALTSADEPVTSRRLENLRDGIEDADLARMVVARHGRKALLAILARERIFSIRGGRLLLGCTSGCDLRTATKYAWPRYRQDRGNRASARSRAHGAAPRRSRRLPSESYGAVYAQVPNAPVSPSVAFVTWTTNPLRLPARPGIA